MADGGERCCWLKSDQFLVQTMYRSAKIVCTGAEARGSRAVELRPLIDCTDNKGLLYRSRGMGD